MAMTPIATFNVSPTPSGSDIQEVQYTSRADVIPSAVKMTTLAVENLVIMPAPSGGVTVTGTFANHGTASLQRAVVYFFPVNAAGRPLDVAQASNQLIERETNWNFQLQVRGPVDKYVAFPIYGQ